MRCFWHIETTQCCKFWDYDMTHGPKTHFSHTQSLEKGAAVTNTQNYSFHYQNLINSVSSMMKLFYSIHVCREPTGSQPARARGMCTLSTGSIKGLHWACSLSPKMQKCKEVCGDFFINKSMCWTNSIQWIYGNFCCWKWHWWEQREWTKTVKLWSVEQEQRH